MTSPFPFHFPIKPYMPAMPSHLLPVQTWLLALLYHWICLSLYLKCPLPLCPTGKLLLLLQNPTQSLPTRWTRSCVALHHHHIYNISLWRPLRLHVTMVVHRSSSRLEWELLEGRTVAYGNCFPGSSIASVTSWALNTLCGYGWLCRIGHREEKAPSYSGKKWLHVSGNGKTLVQALFFFVCRYFFFF